METYKFSTDNIETIVQFLKDEFNFNWDATNTPQMLNETDCFVYLGQIPNQINPETGEVISWLDGFHFDILTSKELSIPTEIIQHKSLNPKHTFA